MNFNPEIDDNIIRRGDYVLYVHDRLGLIYARIVFTEKYKVCLFPLHKDATKRRSYIYTDKSLYLLPTDEVPTHIQTMANTHKKAKEWWL